jgi:FkbM family methyltransferase
LDTYRSRQSFSQFGEDKVLRTLLPERFGRYLDIGAGHAVKNSNSFLFYKLGWHGTLVEPISQIADVLKKKRPRDLVENCLIGLQSEGASTEIFFEFSPSELSTTDIDRASRLIEDGYSLVSQYRVPIRRISDFTGAVTPSEPFFMSLDIEGLDYSVLKDIDWQNFLPRVICVENPEWNEPRNRITQVLSNQGYELVSSHMISAIYLQVKK